MQAYFWAGTSFFQKHAPACFRNFDSLYKKHVLISTGYVLMSRDVILEEESDFSYTECLIKLGARKKES